MNLIRNLSLIFFLLNLVACTTQVKGPITGTTYKVDVGCAEDMQRYKEEREQVVGKDDKKIEAKDIKLDCPAEEPPK